MTVSDTHADTPGASLDELFQPRWQTYRELAASIPETDPPHPAAGVASMLMCASHEVEQLLAEIKRERARADRAEAALAVVAEILSHPRFDADDEIVILRKEVRVRLSGVVTGHALANRIAALSAGSGGREPT